MPVGQVFDLLRGMPAGLGDVLAHCWAKADAHTLGGIADKDAEAVAVALAKVVGHQGVATRTPRKLTRLIRLTRNMLTCCS